MFARVVHVSIFESNLWKHSSESISWQELNNKHTNDNAIEKECQKHTGKLRYNSCILRHKARYSYVIIFLF